MEIEGLQRNWQALGEQDPLWAILSTPGKRRGAWDLDEFFATGQTDVGSILTALSEHDVALQSGRALDFGCGVGRLTQALAEHFDRCDGVDLAASMVEQAQSLNRDRDRVYFHQNQAPNLELFADRSFDFVLTLLVLQHMEPGLMTGYLGEFVRVLRPGGVAYFNVPERAVLGDPLPPEAWVASVSLNAELPIFTAGRTVPLELSVRNDSPVAWPASAGLKVGDHWRTDAGAMVVFDGARAQIDADLESGQKRPVQLEVVTPSEPGDYVLEVDLVQEMIGWFSDRCSGTLRVPVTVVDSEDGREGTTGQTQTNDSGSFSPSIEMYSLSRSAVAAAVSAAGGEVLAEIPLDRCGPSFPSVDYIIRRTTSTTMPPLHERLMRRVAGRAASWTSTGRSTSSSDSQRSDLSDSTRALARLLRDKLVGSVAATPEVGPDSSLSPSQVPTTGPTETEDRSPRTSRRLEFDRETIPWLDKYYVEIQAYVDSLSPEERPSYNLEAQLAHWMRFGYVTFQGAVDGGLIDDYLADVDEFMAAPGDSKIGMVIEGYGVNEARDLPPEAFSVHHRRIMDFHNASTAGKQLALHPLVVEFLVHVFRERVVAMQSLTFDYGTEQPLHQDFAYVVANIPSHLAASWIALEDAHPDAGPLVYLPGSHNIEKVRLG